MAVGKGHSKLIYTIRAGGKMHGPEHERTLREAIANGRAMERLLTERGRAILSVLH